MLFNSFSFILFFLPLSLTAYYSAAFFHKRLAVAVLVAASLFFYSWWNPSFLLLCVGSIAFNYTAGLIILRTANRERLQGWIVFAAVLTNILLLFHYKYLYPLMSWLDGIGLHIPRHVDSVILPLGISFFTFTQIGYLVDCKAGITKGGKLLDYMLFVTFFPHLIAGPILHHREMIPQFVDKETYRFKPELFSLGITIFIMGLAKKVLLADHFAPLANSVFVYPEGAGIIEAWGGALSYALQLYFDFSGYSEMAVGLALMFGIRFPANFNSPYKAQNIIDFWQRWHMTLTRYLTLYLYDPVALWVTRRRMKQGKMIARKGASTPGGFFSMIAGPTFFTMALAGIWHGAGLQFLIYGLLHACYLTVNHAWRLWQPPKSAPSKPGHIFGIVWKTALTLLSVIVAEVFFRAISVRQALVLLHAMVHRQKIALPSTETISPDFLETILKDQIPSLAPWLNQIHFGAPLTVLLGFFWVLVLPNILQLTAAYQPTLSRITAGGWQWTAWRPSFVWACLVGLIASLAILAITGTTEFLYFKF